jgi:hypothetical protein
MGHPAVSVSAALHPLAFFGSLLAHVEQAEARQAIVDEQLLLDKLIFDLAELHGAHAGAIGSQFARGVLFHADEQIFGSGGADGREEFFFKDRETEFEVFKIFDSGDIVVQGVGVTSDGGG